MESQLTEIGKIYLIKYPNWDGRQLEAKGGVEWFGRDFADAPVVHWFNLETNTWKRHKEKDLSFSEYN